MALSRMRIVHRILALAVVAGLGVLAVVAIFFAQRANEMSYRHEIDRLNEIGSRYGDLQTAINENRRLEKHFLLQKDGAAEAEFETVSNEARTVMSGLSSSPVGDGKVLLDRIRQDYDAYAQAVIMMMEKGKALGLVPSEGLEGKMREAVHGIEAELDNVDEEALMTSMLMLRRHEKDFMLRKDPKYVGQHADEVAKFTTLAKERLPAELQATILAALDVYAKAFEAYSGVVIEEGAARKAADDAYGVLQPELKSALDKAAAAARAQFAASDAAVVRSQTIAIGVVAATLVILGLAVFFIGRSISRPITGMSGAMERLAEGDTEVVVTGLGRRDEIGEMAKALEVFRQAAISNLDLQREAEDNRRRAEAERVRLQQEAEASAQARLKEATAGLAEGLRKLAAGDLAFELHDAFAPDFEQLRHDLNQAVGQLGMTLGEVAGSTQAIDGGSGEISRSANDLARRTEQQAASLEETAAALDEITANVTASSQRAEEARQTAEEANRSAAKSAAVADNAIEAMRRIESSSSQISNIIGVIDDIAFQTNLLALNAGVEAARAGEAGKGFAVVAQEVRELAQRSAQAAREIKSLITQSGAEVSNGVELVSATSDALRTIGAHVVSINQHIEAIATAAREQSVGLTEVNTAVNRMDQVTQQNAAMVEEANAASATLATEAGRLRNLVAVFNLPARDAASGAARAA